jgi:hypothetical protein
MNDVKYVELYGERVAYREDDPARATSVVVTRRADRQTRVQRTEGDSKAEPYLIAYSAEAWPVCGVRSSTAEPRSERRRLPTGFVTISRRTHNTGRPPVTATRAPEM